MHLLLLSSLKWHPSLGPQSLFSGEDLRISICSLPDRFTGWTGRCFGRRAASVPAGACLVETFELRWSAEITGIFSPSVRTRTRFLFLVLGLGHDGL